MRPGAGGRQSPPPGRRQQTAVRFVRAFGDGDTQAIAQLLGYHAFDRHVPAADEQRCHGIHARIQAGRESSLDPPHVSLGRREVLLGGKQERHIDRHSGEDRGLNRGNALRRARDLDEQIGAVCSRVQLSCRLDRARGIVGEQGRHLQRHPPIDSTGAVVDRAEQIGGLGQILEGEVEEQPFT